MAVSRRVPLWALPEESLVIAVKVPEARGVWVGRSLLVIGLKFRDSGGIGIAYAGLAREVRVYAVGSNRGPGRAYLRKEKYRCGQ